MPSRITSEDQRLISAYQEEALKLQRMLQSGENLRAILGMVDATLDELTAAYISETLPRHFRDGSEEAIRRGKRGT